MQELPEKVLKYEHFLNERLRVDLRVLSEQRDKCYEEISQYCQLLAIIERQLIDAKGPIKAQVDLGCHFYAQAVVPDPSHICVYVGYGFYVEFTPKEATKFVKKKTKLLEENAKKLSESMTSVRAQIRTVLEGLRELQGLSKQT